ncbi:hypothetical protein [Ferrovibrio sp.]|uniref:hypothetical protein n=1 Tax=Ferrovibrio sp. TaxID=1917215 RepID=UPI003D0B5199
MSEIGRIPPAAPAPAAPASTPAPAPATTPAPAPASDSSSASAANTILDSRPAQQPGNTQQSGRPANTAPQPSSDQVRTSDVAQAARSGSTLEANVVARDGNAFVLRSQGGTTFVIASNPTLAAVLNQGAAVRLAVQPGTPPTAALMAANGTPLNPPLAVLLQNPSPVQLAMAVAPLGAAAQAATLPGKGQVLSATVVQGAGQVQAVAGATPAMNVEANAGNPLPPGSQAQLVVRATAEPGAQLPAAATTAAAAAKAALPPALAAQLPQGASGVMTGVVTGQNPAGQTLLRTAQGMLALDLPQALPAGSQLALELTALVRPAAPSVTQLSPLPAAGILQRLQGGWPLLQSTIDALRQSHPDLAARLAQAMPQANARLASNALQFMAAAAMGSAQAWLGAEATRALREAGKGDLLARLDEDFRDLGKLNQRGSGDSDWQALTLPMMVQGKVEPVQIFMRRRRDRKKNQTQSRFILDFNLESTGPVQFDGYMADKRLDLVLRSLHEFGPAFKLDVQAIFDDAMAITGMTGTLRFIDREPPIPWPNEAGLDLGPGPHQQVEA